MIDKPKYTKFDAELMRLIKEGKNRMMVLETNKPLLDMARPFCKNDGKPKWKHTEPWRIIDRRLQALRKKGLIAHDSKAGWFIVNEAA